MPINEAIEELEKKLNLMQMSPQLQAEAKRHLDNIKSQASSLMPPRRLAWVEAS